MFVHVEINIILSSIISCQSNPNHCIFIIYTCLLLHIVSITLSSIIMLIIIYLLLDVIIKVHVVSKLVLHMYIVHNNYITKGSSFFENNQKYVY